MSSFYNGFKKRSPMTIASLHENYLYYQPSPDEIDNLLASLRNHNAGIDRKLISKIKRALVADWQQSTPLIRLMHVLKTTTYGCNVSGV